MTEPLTLVLPAKADEERDMVAVVWERSFGPVVRVDRFWEPPVLDRATVRLFGNDTFCLVLAQLLGVELVSPPDDWVLTLPSAVVGREVARMRLGDAGSLDYPRFVKPLVPKQFAAAVYQDRAALDAETVGLDADTELFASEVVEISAEIRCFILDGQVRTAACYEGSAGTDAALQVVAAAVSAVPIPRTFVVDLALVGTEWQVLEANATWGAGLNGCDAREVAQCIAFATVAPPSGQ